MYVTSKTTHLEINFLSGYFYAQHFKNVDKCTVNYVQLAVNSFASFNSLKMFVI